MPRRKNSINAFGKSWGPIDIPNLEKAINLFERLNYLQDHFKGSLSSSQEIMQQINETAEIKTKLDNLGIKLTEQQAKELLNVLKQRKEENELLTKNNDLKGSTSGILIGDNNTKQQGYSRPSTTSNISFSNVGDIYSGIRQSKDYNKAVQLEVDKIKAAGSIMSDDSIKKFAESNIKNGRMSSEAADLLGKSATKYNAAASVLQVAANTFKAGVDILSSLFTSGFNNQKEALRNNSLLVGSMTQTTTSQLVSANNQTNNQLGSWMPYSSSDDLRDNIRSSEVIEMWGQLAKSGASQETMFANAIDNIVTNKIVPYLDTGSAAWQRLAEAQPDLQKNIRGINSVNQEIAGNNYITEDLLNQIIYDLQPMSELATNDLAMSASGASATINSLMEQNPQMTEDQAIALYKELYNQQYRGADILKGGSTTEKLAYIQNLTSGVNIYDSADVPEAIGNIVGAKQFTANLSGLTYDSSYSGLLLSTLGNAVGQSGEDMMTYNKENMDPDSIVKAVNDGNKAQEKLSESAQKEYEKFEKGLYQTEAEKQEIYMENLSNELVGISTEIGYWGDLIVTAIKGIAGAVAATVIGKGIGALAGSSFGGSGAGLLASGGGMALATIGGAAAITAITGAIVNAGNTEKMSESARENDNERFAQGLQSNSASNALSGMTNMDDNLDNVWWDLGQGTKAIGGGLGQFTNMIGNIGADANSKTANNWKSLKIGFDTSGTSEIDRQNMTMAFMLLADEGGTLESIGVTHDDMIKLLLENGNLYYAVESQGKAPLYAWSPYDTSNTIIRYNSDRYIDSILNELSSDESKQYLNEYSEAMYGDDSENSHRYGLSYVPYDDYQATLHEGEAVLTANTAEELRNLLNEYRQTNQANINYEAIIQTQTETLAAKLDQVINAINDRRMSMASASSYSSAMYTNMREIKSLKSFE